MNICKTARLSAVAALLFFMTAPGGHASDYLLFFEAQGVAGYSEKKDGVIWYSKTAEDVMQKPSIGFDYIQRFSGQTGDFGQLAVQARLAYDERDADLELQWYNAYFKYKHKVSDVWIGHNRPALGLSSYFDTHSHLLSTLPMNSFGFDRDWGVGAYRDFSWGNAAASLTTGSGMPIYFKDNYLISARISGGALYMDNYNIGFSAAYGDIFHTMGYERMMHHPERFAMAGADAAYLWDNYEIRFDALAGKNMGKNAFALFGRFGVNLLDEARLKLEFQPVAAWIGDNDNYQISLGVSYILNANITLRAMADYDQDTDDFKMIFQIYYYKKL
jgi:hypothetical protein